MRDDLPDEYNEWFLVKWLRGKCANAEFIAEILFNNNKFIAVLNVSLSESFYEYSSIVLVVFFQPGISI